MMLSIEALAWIAVGVVATFLAFRFWQAVRQQEALIKQQKTLMAQNEVLRKELADTREALRVCEGSK